MLELIVTRRYPNEPYVVLCPREQINVSLDGCSDCRDFIQTLGTRKQGNLRVLCFYDSTTQRKTKFSQS